MHKLFSYASLFYKLAASQPIILYHGTNAKNLPSILSQGLIPFPKERAWQEDPQAYEPMEDSVPREGVYQEIRLGQERPAETK